MKKPVYLFNTLTRQREEFTPINNDSVRMYHCGPTVYGTQHLGNFRAFIVWDILHRIMEFNGYEVKFVINITDVGHLTGDNLGNADVGEDRMTKGLLREGMAITLANMIKLGEKYEKQFTRDLKKLNIKLPASLPRASDHIAEDIDVIKALEEKGFTYTTSDGVYFDTSKDPNYGVLRGKNADNEGESRLEKNSEKINPSDFALWKFDKNLGWDSPWGKGFPGWHIECSAMSEKYLSLPFDIHTGGIEHIPVHHTNEIAQTENARGTKMANYWLHNNHLQIDGEKIAKSVGNVVYVSDLEERGYSPIAFRYLVLGAHYRSLQNFTFEALDAASQALKRIKEHLSLLPEGGKADTVYMSKFEDSINADLGTPQAVAVLWEVIKDEGLDKADKKATILEFDKILGLGLSELSPIEIPDEVKKLVKEREGARIGGDFEKADELRKKIEDAGFSVKDTEDGPRILKSETN